jgi:hypothetical protein
MRRMPTTCHHAWFIDTLPVTKSAGLRSGGSLRLAIIQSRPVTPSHVQWRQSRPVAPVTSSGNRCLLVTPSHAQWQQVSPGGSAIAFRFAPRAPN